MTEPLDDAAVREQLKQRMIELLLAKKPLSATEAELLDDAQESLLPQIEAALAEMHRDHPDLELTEDELAEALQAVLASKLAAG